MQTEQLLCWSDMTDTEHSTSGSNEVVVTSKSVQPVHRNMIYERSLSPLYTQVELSVDFCFFHYRSFTLIDASEHQRQ